jgi:hypothetical protein
MFKAELENGSFLIVKDSNVISLKLSFKHGMHLLFWEKANVKSSKDIKRFLNKTEGVKRK